MTGISEHYRKLNAVEAAVVAKECAEAWQHPQMPIRQWEQVVYSELADWRRGKTIRPYQVAVQCLRMLPNLQRPTLLDVGASSGYYSEVLKVAGFDCDYTGLDFSEAYRELARKAFPGIRFDVGRAEALPYATSAFDIVLHSACIMHCAEYRKAIAEAARVSSRYVIFHRTPIIDGYTAYFEKEAYGIRCLEVHFNEEELFELFAAAGLKLIGTVVSFDHRSYVLEKELFHHQV